MRRANLIAERARHGWKQEYVAQAVGVSVQTVSNWENARSKPDSDKAIALEALFEDVPLKTLLEVTDSEERVA